MPLRYSDHLAKCPDQPCPCTQAFVPRECAVFRFLGTPADEERDFTPIAFRGGHRPRKNLPCDWFALSLFSSLELARKKYRSLAARIDAEARFGTHIGRLDVGFADGRISEPGPDGHMGLHPEIEARFAHRVTAYYPAMERE